MDLFSKVSDFPVDPMGKSAHITLIGNREAIIDGCYGIVEYTDARIRINIGNQMLCLTGCDFDIFDYSSTAITVRGRVNGLEFC